MDKNTEFVITSEGRMFQRQKPVEHEIFIMDRLKQAFNKDMAIHRVDLIPLEVLEGKSFLECEAGSPKISASLNQNGLSYFWIPVRELKLNTHYKTDIGGITYPVFSSEYPIFELLWKPPVEMALFLVVAIADYNIESGIFLVALDSELRQWRLPLSNLYDDCKLCNGSYDRSTISLLHALRAAWDQFNTSRWNGDLYEGHVSGDMRNKTQSLFSFKANNGGFEQLLPAGKWELLCQKISNPILTDCNPFTP